MGDGARLEVHPGEVRHLAGNGETHVRHIYERSAMSTTAPNLCASWKRPAEKRRGFDALPGRHFPAAVPRGNSKACGLSVGDAYRFPGTCAGRLRSCGKRGALP